MIGLSISAVVIQVPERLTAAPLKCFQCRANSDVWIVAARIETVNVFFFFYCVMWWTYFKDHLHWCTYCMSEDVFNPPSQYAIMSTVQLGFKTCPTVHDLRAPTTHLYADVKLIFVFHLPSNFRIYRNITSRFWTPMSATQSCVQRHDKACLEEDERHIIKTIPAF